MADRKLQILIVEDDKVDRMVMMRALNASGINAEITFAHDHESGKEVTRDKTFDCIFLDYNLPDGTGIELMQAIRLSGNQSPIIVVTSHGGEKIAVEAMKSGASDYIPKSLLTPEGLAQSLRYAIRFREAELAQARIEKELNESQTLLNTVVSHSPIILFAFDSNGVFTLFEGKGVEDMKADKNKILGKSIYSYSNMFPQILDIYKRTMKGEDVTATLELKDRFFQAFYSPVKDEAGRITGVIGISTDITDHIKAEKELRKAKQLAEETSKIKEQFLANMSHEIRTPMNGIIGLTHILLNTKLDQEQIAYMQSIKASSDNLLVIVNDILDFSKIEAGRMKFERVPFSMPEVAQNCIDLFKAKAEEKNIRINNQCDLRIPSLLFGDPTRLSQILNNLVGNAVKFTQAGEVTMNISIQSKRNDCITLDFKVKDTGIGIPEESIGQIFNSFTQASNDTTRKFGGTGLGLTIVKNLIELQGGSIQVKSKVGTGTTFNFHLTFEIATKPAPKPAGNNAKDNTSLHHLNILVAEDNAINQMIVKKILNDWNASVECAENGLMAFEKLKSKYFDIILMDIQMPEMDGYTASKKIREELDEPNRSTPILAMTAHAAPTEKQKCFDHGMNDYISKPFNPADLKKKIIDLTKNKQSETPVASKNDSTHATDPSTTKTPLNQSQHSVMKEKEQENSTRPATQSPGKTQQVIKNQPEGIDAKIDLSYLKEISDGNEAFMVEMIEMFLSKTPDALEKMNESFQKQNWEELRQIAHRIKPSYSYVGLPEIQIMLTEIETCSQTRTDLEKIQIMISQVKQTSKSAFKDLENELSGLK